MVIDYLGGIFYGTFFNIVIVTLVMPTMYAIVYCAELYGVTTYHEVLGIMCGKGVEKVVVLTLIVTSFAVCVSYLILIGDQFDRIFLTFFGSEFCQHWYMNRKFTITLVSVLFIWPMTYFKRIHFLNYVMKLGKYQ